MDSATAQQDFGPSMVKQKRRVRTPTVLQMEAVECGAASLSMVLGYFNYRESLETLRVECGVTRDGSKASNLLRAARRYGLKARGFRKEPHQLAEMPLPLIVFWNFNHFVVLEGFGPKWVYLNDPATGPRKVSYEEFDDSFTGVALSFEPGEDFKAGGEKPSLVGSLKRRLKGSESGLGFLVLATLFLVIPGLVVPAFSKIFVDQVLIESRQEWLRPLLLAMALALALQSTLTILQKQSLRRLEVKLAIKMSSEFFRRVLSLPVQFFQQRFAGEIANRVALNDRIAQLLSGDLATNFVGLGLLIFYGGVMLLYDWVLALIGMGIAGVNLLVLQAVSQKRKDINARLLQDQGKLAGSTMSGLQIIESLKASGTEGHFFAQWAGYQAKFLNGMQRLGVTNQFLAVLPTTLQALNTAIILGFGGYRVMEGVLSMGDLVAFQVLMGNFIRPVNEFVRLGGSVQEIDGNLKRLDDVLQNEPAVDFIPSTTDNSGEPTGIPVKMTGFVEVRDLAFGYSPLEPAFIDGFNLTVQPGERVAFVGPSGCGKSTLAKVLSGLYEPWRGDILFDGFSREQYPRHYFVNSFAAVDQDIFLFEGTIKENLTLWDKTVPNENLVRACKDACIHDIISERSGGYESRVAEGGRNFSGGQRQRLEIARALVRNPRVLILDEATSALDPTTEHEIDLNLRRRGCSCLIIAHRLSTIRDCDQIVVLNKGKVVQQGDPESLMRDREGFFAKLVNA